jgi:isoquinoline 1-oxidoreductase beta subunit
MLTSNALAPASHRPLSRRSFLGSAGASLGALVVGTTISFRGDDAQAATMSDAPMPNAFIRIAPDNLVTVIIKHLDKGQGVSTGLTTIVADELDADWGQMRSVFAPVNAEIYNNLLYGPLQGTGSSTSIANSWEQLRKAGAAARAMLIAAAADQWKVRADEVAINRGVVSHTASGRRATFGDLAAKAATMPVPAAVKPKDPKDWAYIGKHVPRIDSVAKTTGRAVYAMDVKRPGMLTAVVARPPRFGATAASFDATMAKQVKGVIDVVQIPQGVAVLGRDTWSAIKGREALKVEWDDSKAEKRSSATILADYRRAAEGQGLSAAKHGDAAAALKGAAKIIEAEFVFPYLAHAPMEPLNGVIEVKADGAAEVWAGSQLQTLDQGAVAAILGLKPEQVTVNTLWAGGSFGRRATPTADYFSEMAMIAKATRGKAPIHLVWTREDDLRGGRYRPMFYDKVRAGLDAAGNLVAWEHRTVGQSFMIGTPMEGFAVKNGVDAMTVEGAADMPYAIPNLAVDWYPVQSPITTLWWRSVGHSRTAQTVEVMIDELAQAAGKDPVDFRLSLLRGHPRHITVLKLAAEKAGWGATLPAGRGRGVAVHESFNSYVAMVADVVANADGSIAVERIVAAVDCGVPINPDVIRAQLEGGIGFGLGAALRNRITLTDGVVDQTNFDGYEPLRISDMPRVEVHIVPSNEPPTGIGEPGVPPVAPAVTNAIRAATGKSLHSLPWGLDVRKNV